MVHPQVFSCNLIFFIFPILLSFPTNLVNGLTSNGFSYEIHEKRSEFPLGWNRGSRLDGETIIPIRIALKQNNMDKLEDYIMEVSDPKSSQYGKHWSSKRVRETFSPSVESREKVSDWLISSGISSERLNSKSNSTGWIQFDAKVKEVEKLFKTEYYSWFYESISDPIIAMKQQYSLPNSIRSHIDFILPSLQFGKKVKSRLNTKRSIPKLVKRSVASNNSLPKASSKSLQIDKELQDCDQQITPACLRALYQIPTLSPTQKINPHNTFGIAEFTPQTYLESDLKEFFKRYSVEQKQIKPILISIDGGGLNSSEKSVDLNSESDLDLQYSITLLNPIEVILYQAGDFVEGLSDNDFLDAFDSSFCKGDDPEIDQKYPDPQPGGYKGKKDCGNKLLAKIISKTYSFDEIDFTPSYEIRQCNEYGKLALMGITFINAISDFGVAGSQNNCLNPKTNEKNDGKLGKFLPSFPATCPYVLSVGSTQILSGHTVYDSEVVWQALVDENDGSTRFHSSGGGFSNVFGIPSYQRSAIEHYNKYHKPIYSSNQYNDSQNSRGYPDVSINGRNFITITSGEEYLIDGTSASTPIFASVLGLINEARMDIGKSSLGFIHPAIYSNPTIFNDIISGSNSGCGTKGFNAVQGWDPVSGYGTPNYTKMLEYFLHL